MVDKPIFELSKIENAVKPTLGLYVCVGPSKPVGEEPVANQITELNFTGKPGTASSIYYSLFFQLPKWDFHIEKADEWIEVSPTHREYYERTMATKQMLESTIKTGLTSAAQAVADFELMNHDLRKYRQILSYFHEKDEHSLKSMFIDQVDIHTGVLSIGEMTRNRWPTMTADFHRLNDDDKDWNEIGKKYKVSRAEAIILATKNRLFVQWKKTFGDVAKERYQTIKGLLESRRKSIDEYRNWLKPYIARFKMTKLGGERERIRTTTLKSFADVTGIASFANVVRVFGWKPLRTAEMRRPAAEIRTGKGLKEGFVIYPYDDYVRNDLILDTENGLASSEYYPWLNNDRKYCPKCKEFYPTGFIKCSKCGSANLILRKVADEIVEKEIIPMWKDKGMGLDPSELYYMFLDFDILRLGTRLPVGELEDITFTIRTYVLSQNIMLLKILELKCMDIELERYIDEILGVRTEEKEISDIVSEEFPSMYKEEESLSGAQQFAKEVRESFKAYSSIFKKIKTPKIGKFMFFKPGYYEKGLRDRLTKQYLAVSGANFGVVVNFLKTKMGVE